MHENRHAAEPNEAASNHVSPSATFQKTYGCGRWEFGFIQGERRSHPNGRHVAMSNPALEHVATRLVRLKRGENISLPHSATRDARFGWRQVDQSLPEISNASNSRLETCWAETARRPPTSFSPGRVISSCRQRAARLHVLHEVFAAAVSFANTPEANSSSSGAIMRGPRVRAMPR